MTTTEKLTLIDAYLAEGCTDPKWRDMILEYRQLLLAAEQKKDAEPD